MKLFENTGHSGNYNWVDKNNVAAGFDMSSSCCENYGYEYTNTPGGEVIVNPDIEAYSFDQSFFDDKVVPKQFGDDYGMDGGGAVCFKMVNDKDPEAVLYLTFYNCQNGYYGHGFDFKVGETVLRDGCI